MQSAPDNSHEDLSTSPTPGPEPVPRHVAIIMDGNGRWARRLGLPRRRGHSEGAESVRVIIRECSRLGVEQLTLYAFSTENWRRPRTEVRLLMALMKRFLISERGELIENNLRLRAIGRLAKLPEAVRRELERSIEISAKNTGMIVRLALNYGGRQEILDAARKLALESQRDGRNPGEWTEQDLKRCLYDAEMTDPDMLIRTGGEMRLSNFLLWELSYAELWFTRTCWPEFRTAHLRQAFRAYAHRERRFGGLKGQRPAATRSASLSGSEHGAPSRPG
jgi:undecaprenyl diphosphate synthase